MAAIETFYGNGGVQTNTQGLSLTGGGDLNSVLAELVRRKMQQQPAQAPRAVSQAPMRPMRETQYTAPPPEKSELERARERAELLRLKAAEDGPPMRYTNGGYGSPTTAGHLEMDDQHMNAYQRQMYLPGGAGMSPGGADTRGDEQETAEELLRLRAQLEALRGQGREDAALWNPNGGK